MSQLKGLRFKFLLLAAFCLYIEGAHGHPVKEEETFILQDLQAQISELKNLRLSDKLQSETEIQFLKSRLQKQDEKVQSFEVLRTAAIQSPNKKIESLTQKIFVPGKESEPDTWKNQPMNNYPAASKQHEDFEQNDDETSSASRNKEELGGKFEGDMILQSSEIPNSGLVNPSSLWPEGRVIYKLDGQFTTSEKMKILNAMREMTVKTCIEFKERLEDEPGFVEIIRGSGSGCWAEVGYLGRRQKLNLDYDGCLTQGTIMHELMHTLGFFHEQSRTDRDDYIEINYSNIHRSNQHNFEAYPSSYITDYGIPYDYSSIMHYTANAFSINPNLPTIISKNPSAVMGNRKFLSEKDIERIQRRYKTTDFKCQCSSPTTCTKSPIPEGERPDAQKLQIQKLTTEVESLKQKFLLIENVSANLPPLSQSMTKIKEKLEVVQKTARLYNNQYMNLSKESYSLAPRARFYSGVNYTGSTEDYNVDPYYFGKGCYNLKKLQGNVISVNTYDTCVRLFTNENCKGNVVRVLPGIEPSRNDILSVGPCIEGAYDTNSIYRLRSDLDTLMAKSTTGSSGLPEAKGERGEGRPGEGSKIDQGHLNTTLQSLLAEIVKNKENLELVKKTADSYAITARARFYSGENKTGSTEDYNVDPYYYGQGCYNLKSLQGKVKSVNTYDTCVRLFTKENCAGTMARVYPGKKMAISAVSSVGPCFEEPHGTKSIEYLSKVVGALASPYSRARLYTGVNKTGSYEDYQSGNGYTVGCYNLTSVAGKVKSIDPLGTIFRVYEDEDCSGLRSTIHPGSTVLSDTTALFEKSIKSIGPWFEAPYHEYSIYRLKLAIDKLRGG